MPRTKSYHNFHWGIDAKRFSLGRHIPADCIMFPGVLSTTALRIPITCTRPVELPHKLKGAP